MTLVDTNVLLDLATDDQKWFDWSTGQLRSASLAGPLMVNVVIYAELAVRYEDIGALDAFLRKVGCEIVPIPKEALFLAGKVYAQYRRAGGTRTGVLPDFFIGAHASVAGIPLLTRDIRRYRTYFPALQLIAPDSE
ncbi:DNA-binding protein [Brucella endophytica]|uniref:DNA-binding protein n=1 Tax=Brucella endophytica TaxID=1963359 RepID=A0A916SAV4_9HYPH|nr:type II toxin-antitoxin system VapC family toxin [Brucella endophytica]GGA91613.1 DNA-binding protein [Brucella endophytica]